MPGIHVPETLAALSPIGETAAALEAGGGVLEGIVGSAAVVVASELRRRAGRGLLLVVADEDAADDAEGDLHSFDERDVLHFAPWDVLPGETDRIDLETFRERVQVLRRLLRYGRSGRAPIVVAPVTALMQPTIHPDDLVRTGLTASAGMEMAPEAIAARLADAGFEAVVNVEAPGQFSRRGGILDVFPFFAEEPVRLDFFGDTVETIWSFDPMTQRSGDPVEECVLVDISTTAVEAAFHRKGRRAMLADYLAPDAGLLVIEPARCVEMATLYEEGIDVAHSPVVAFRTACEAYAGRPVLVAPWIHGEAWPEPFPGPGSPQRIDFRMETLQRLEGSTEHAIEEMTRFVEGGDRLTLGCHNEAARARCRQVLLEAGEGLAASVDLVQGRVARGFRWPEAGWTVVGDHEVFHRDRRRRRVRKRVPAGTPIRTFTELRPGDYVVHLLHGIGRYAGLVRLDQNGQTTDFLSLRFADDATLYVPLSHIDLVQKYIGGGESRPELSRLGGKAWAKKKASAEKAVREAAAELLRIQAVRQHSPGIAAPGDDDWMRQFEEEFFYEETEDQLAAMAEIKADQEREVPMDRILCGDVGFGKTELAMRAAFKTIMGGRQVAVLVPTTILAEQHYRSFSERMADYPVNVQRLSRFKSPARQRRVVEQAKAGEVDVLIGTHRLLSADVGFKDLGLAIVDEEQRFGVEHKERLKHLRASVDVLTMTATPIPRTLHMGLLGLRDISALKTPPQDRQAIRTQVVRFREEIIRRAVLRELSRGGQIYFVHNRVQTIDHIAVQLAEMVPEARIGIGHGQMNEHDLEEVMIRFLRGDLDILVATTIIESGLDIPNVNTIFINQADHFGLSQLHQLRGRVGRYRNRAYAYLLVPGGRPPSPVGQKRLQAIEEYAGLGAGFDLAMRDLEIRGAGNLLGLEQSGHIHQVGYDLYCRLLEKVVKELQGEEVEEAEPVEFELGTDAFLPDDYVPLEEERLKLYRDFAAVADEAALADLRLTVRDRYGEPPPPVEQLFADWALRLKAREVGINFAGRLDRAVTLGFAAARRDEAVGQLRRYTRRGRKATPLSEDRWRLGLGPGEDEWPGYHRDLVETAIGVLRGEEPLADEPAGPARRRRPSWLGE